MGKHLIIIYLIYLIIQLLCYAKWLRVPRRITKITFYLKHKFLFIISYVANLADDFILTLNSKPH